jgi:hypothetical protein
MKILIALIFLLIPNYADNAVIMSPPDDQVMVVDNEPEVMVEFGLIFIREIDWR